MCPRIAVHAHATWFRCSDVLGPRHRIPAVLVHVLQQLHRGCEGHHRRGGRRPQRAQLPQSKRPALCRACAYHNSLALAALLVGQATRGRNSGAAPHLQRRSERRTPCHAGLLHTPVGLCAVGNCFVPPPCTDARPCRVPPGLFQQQPATVVNVTVGFPSPPGVAGPPPAAREVTTGPGPRQPQTHTK